MIRAVAAVLVLGVLPLAAAATAPERSLRPVARGQVVGGQVLPAGVFETMPATPQLPASRAPNSTATVGLNRYPQAGATAPGRSLRPRARPSHVVQQARAVTVARQKGAVCGDVALQGVAIGDVPGKISGCGVSGAVRLQSVAGIPLTTHAVMNCETAQALKTWVERGVKPAVRGYGGGVDSLKVAAHYACRPRNNQKGSKISEHGKGRAIDISEIRLKDGRALNLLEDWGKGREGRMLKTMHSAACGPFGTVLGPEANRFHLDHFHFDTAAYRSGSYCR